MATEVTFDLPYSQWNWQIGVYIAMIGIASGAYLMGYVADLLASRRDAHGHGQVAKYGYLVGLLGLVIGPPILLSHLATPFRAMLIPLTMTNFDSWMTIGAYLLGGLGLGAFLMFVWVAFGRNRPHAPERADSGAVAADGGTERDAARAATTDRTDGLRGVADRVGLLDLVDSLADTTRPSETVRLALGGVFSIAAAGVLIYSAMAYGSGMTERVALWDKTFLLPVQIFSGLGVGLAGAVGLAAVAGRNPGRAVRQYSLVIAGLLAATLAMVVATIVLLPGQSPAAEPGINNLLTTYAVPFVGLAVIGGLVVPILLSVGAVVGQRRDALSPTAATATYATVALLAVVGKISLALSYLLAAEFEPLILPL
ncbi:dehydrogenase [Natronococcus sp. A-GB1]|uniref:dehydrogenase n=1 Tax=Natronococcus sp. A-GB1 TaxID=3037648 RepID=UPI00241C1C5A|nr:dehydrogenase [Natronococcus sp. A-GB1]MDG5758601.1 dehydrogenase [Natronococcus sp. A-GB1]